MTVGTATLAIVDDMIIAIAPAMLAIVTSHLLAADAGAVDTEFWLCGSDGGRVPGMRSSARMPHDTASARIVLD